MQFNIICLALLVCFSCTKVIGQSDCRKVKTIVNEIAADNYFKNTKYLTGFMTDYSASIDQQYLRYEELLHCASKRKLQKLLKHKNNVVVAFAWKALLEYDVEEAVRFLLKNKSLNKRYFENLLNTCQGSAYPSLSSHMTFEISQKLKTNEISLSDKTQALFLEFKEKSKKKSHPTNVKIHPDF